MPKKPQQCHSEPVEESPRVLKQAARRSTIRRQAPADGEIAARRGEREFKPVHQGYRQDNPRNAEKAMTALRANL